MVRPGVFDVEKRHRTSFDETLMMEGMFDVEMIPGEVAIPRYKVSLSVEISTRSSPLQVEITRRLPGTVEIARRLTGAVHLG